MSIERWIIVDLLGSIYIYIYAQNLQLTSDRLSDVGEQARLRCWLTLI